MKWIFWASIAVLAYTYLGYAAWLWLRACYRGRPVRTSSHTPSISIVMVVRNEAGVLERKLNNLLSLDYPRDIVEVVVVSDGSTDSTNAILRGHASDPRVRLILNAESRGKAAGLNDAIAVASNEVVMFTDARQKVEVGALRLLAQSFADPEVGCASGELMLGDPDSGEASRGVGLYWRIEKNIREMESLSGSVVGATGAIYAARRNLFVPLPQGTILDDVYIPMHVVNQGFRVIFVPSARAWDLADQGTGHEFARKVRTLTGNYQLVQLAPWILSSSNPLRFEFISHKLLRLFAPFALAAAFVASLNLQQPIYRIALALQIAFYLLGLVAVMKLAKGPLGRVADAAGTFVVLNTAAIVALAKFVTGCRVTWSSGPRERSHSDGIAQQLPQDRDSTPRFSEMPLSGPRYFAGAETFVPEQCGPLPASLTHGLTQSHLPWLDGLRAMAVFLVVFYHMHVPGINGGTGVLIFFVLSGFLITWLLLTEEERFGEISLKAFYLRRTLRIFPAFYVYWFLLVGALVLFSKRLVIGQAICSFLYLNNYYQAIVGDPNTGLSHTWSLGVEEQFYLLWPVTFLMLKGNRQRIRFLLIAIAAVWVYREMLVFVWHAPQGYIYEAFDTRADHLMIGCFLAVALRERVWIRLWSFLVASPSMIWVTLGCLLCSSVAGYHFGSLYRDSASFIIDPILTAVFMVQGIALRSGALNAIFNCRPVRYLGVLSYSIYLYHQITIGAVQKLLRSWPLISPIASILAVIAVASASYWLVERPVQGLKARFSANKPKRNPRAVQAGDSAALVSNIPVVASAFSSAKLATHSVEEAEG